MALCCDLGLSARVCNNLHFDTSRCTVGHGTYCSICKEVADLEKEMQAALVNLQRASQRRSLILKNRVNRHHDPITRCLPVELVSYIFKLYVEGYDDPISLEANPRFSKIECSAPLIISSVCRAWRKIAFSTSCLWTTMKIHVYSADEGLAQSELAREWLDRSGTHELQLTFFYEKAKRPPSTYNLSAAAAERFDFREAASALLGVVKDYAPRWQTLILATNFDAAYKILKGLNSLPALKYLQICSSEVWDSWQIHLPEAPLLQELRMRVPPFSQFFRFLEWANLAAIALGRIDATNIFELLRRAPNLESCEFSSLSSNSSGTRFEVPDIPITHTGLKDLQLGLHYSDEANILWRFLALPSLERLALGIQAFYPNSAPAFPAQEIISFISRSQCAIRVFELKSTARYTLEDEQLIRILKRLSSLESLTLHNLGPAPSTWTTNTLWRRFYKSSRKRTSEARVQFLPSLRHLEVAGIRAFSWERFQKAFIALQARNQTQIPSPSRTSCHRLHVCLKLISSHHMQKAVVKRFREARRDRSISLQISDYLGERDLLQDSLTFHGLAETA